MFTALHPVHNVKLLIRALVAADKFLFSNFYFSVHSVLLPGGEYNVLSHKVCTIHPTPPKETSTFSSPHIYACDVISQFFIEAPFWCFSYVVCIYLSVRPQSELVTGGGFPLAKRFVDYPFVSCS